MRKLTASGCVLILCFIAARFVPAQDLVIENAWARANPPVVPNSAVYLTVQNRGAAADRLLRVESGNGESGNGVAKMLEIHRTVERNNMTSMEPMPEGVPIPANSAVQLAPGGMHIMLTGLVQPLAVGDSFPLRLSFEKAGSIIVNVEVREPGS